MAVSVAALADLRRPRVLGVFHFVSHDPAQVNKPGTSCSAPWVSDTTGVGGWFPILAPTESTQKSLACLQPANFLRTWGCPTRSHWSLTTVCDKLIKIGGRIVRRGRYVVFQPAEVATPRAVLAEILRQMERLRGPPVLAT
jgi:hypothetical protein